MASAAAGPKTTLRRISALWLRMNNCTANAVAPAEWRNFTAQAIFVLSRAFSLAQVNTVYTVYVSSAGSAAPVFGATLSGTLRLTAPAVTEHVA